MIWIAFGLSAVAVLGLLRCFFKIAQITKRELHTLEYATNATAHAHGGKVYSTVLDLAASNTKTDIERKTKPFRSSRPFWIIAALLSWLLWLLNGPIWTVVLPVILMIIAIVFGKR